MYLEIVWKVVMGWLIVNGTSRGSIATGSCQQGISGVIFYRIVTLLACWAIRWRGDGIAHWY